MSVFSTDTVEEAISLQQLFGVKAAKGALKGRYVVTEINHCECDMEALDRMKILEWKMAKAYQEMKERRNDQS